MVKPTLEIEADRKLQLPHRGAIFNIRNLAVVATLAIDTGVRPVVSAEGIHRMVEDIKGIHAELCGQAFVDGELLYNRQVGIEARGSMERILTDVPEVSRSGVRKWTACVRRDVRNWREVSEVVVYRIDIARNSNIEGPLPFIRTANAYVLFATALAKARRPR